LLNAGWNFIGRKRELSTARMIGGERTTLSKKFDFLGYTFRPRGAKDPEARFFVGFQSGHQQLKRHRSNAGDDEGMALTSANGQIFG